MRGPQRHFTHSKVMAWVAFDRAVATVEQLGLGGDAMRWRASRVSCTPRCVQRRLMTVRVHTALWPTGARCVDPHDSAGRISSGQRRGWVVATVEAIQRELTVDGLVRRYQVDDAGDGVGGEEGAFLLCSFWLVDSLALMGRHEEATALYERLLGLRNDVGLLAEEFDLVAGQQLGNFPQAFSHIVIASSAMTLCRRNVGPSEERARANPDDGARRLPEASTPPPVASTAPPPIPGGITSRCRRVPPM